MADDLERIDTSRFNTLFANATDAILVLDGDRRFTEVNAAACALFGATNADIVGRRIDDFAPLDEAVHEATWNRLMGEKWLRGELRIVRPDGVRDVEFTSVIDFFPGLHLSVMRDVTDRKREEEAFRSLAKRDTLTGALNHGAIFSELSRLVGGGTPFSLAVVDIDGLKATNDTHGHLMGDAVLRIAAELLSDDGSLVGRWGGDEFLVLVPGADRVRAEARRGEIMEAAGRSNVVDPSTGNQIEVRITIGVAIFPTEAQSADALIRIADGAMYASRKWAHAAQRINDSADRDTVAKLMSELIPLLATKADLTSKLRLVAQHLSIGAGYDGVDFQLFQTETEAPVMLTTYTSKPEAVSEEWRENQQIEVDGDHELRRLILSTRRPIIFNEIETDFRLGPAERNLLLRTGIRSGVLIPLIWQDEVIGTLGIGSVRTNGFPASDVEFLLAVAHQVTPIIRMGALIDDLEAASDRLAAAQIETVMMLAAAAEASDPGTGEHLRRVSTISELMALELGMSRPVSRAIGLAAILHDIGKIRVPSTILLKPGALTDEEWKTMRKHAAWGAEFLRDHEGFEIAAEVACAHHERWDGLGYPAGLAGEAIPEASRIVAVADAFDAITTDRPYRMGRSYDWAIAEIERHSGTQFDPRMVSVLRRLHARDALREIDGPAALKAA